MWDDFERFELEGAGQNCGEVLVCAFSPTGDCSFLSRLLLMNLLFITPIPLNELSIIEFII
jgi:hypothetical protein